MWPGRCIGIEMRRQRPEVLSGLSSGRQGKRAGVAYICKCSAGYHKIYWKLRLRMVRITAG